MHTCVVIPVYFVWSRGRGTSICFGERGEVGWVNNYEGQGARTISNLREVVTPVIA